MCSFAAVQKKIGGNGMSFYPLLLILTAAAITIAIRFAPFMLFSRGKQLPRWVKYLGNILPPAVMSVLLVYCLRSVDFATAGHGIPELISVAAVILLHIWRRNTLLSIGVGTVLYMILVQVVFV